MPGKVIHLDNINGLSAQQVKALQQQFGKNIFQAEPSRSFLHIIWDIVKEPMFILLVIACSLYFILGELSEGIMMLIAMAIVAAISLYQEVRSANALKALQQFMQPKINVIRDGQQFFISTEELVPGDIILLDEGMNIPADAIVLQDNDFTVNESIITGESLPVEKNESARHNELYQGTTINSGKCIARVTTTGNDTILGKLGKDVIQYNAPKTLLQLQINRFVRRLAAFGLAGFFLIFLINYLHHADIITSLLFALTLAMSAVPEEIPVAFSSFMALGAHKMSKIGIISRQPQVVENLGAVSVICLDKTGTITENKMEVKFIYDHSSGELINLDENVVLKNTAILYYGMLASEKEPFDAMEKAIVAANEKYNRTYSLEPSLKMAYEYPLEGKPPMMTHVYEDKNMQIAAAKGGIEHILDVCNISLIDKNKIIEQAKALASKGYRILGVASATNVPLPLPASQDDFKWNFEGLMALYDPPKKNISEVLSKFCRANIKVKIVTGDYTGTAINIASQVGIIDSNNCLTGNEVMEMSEDELKVSAKSHTIFARMFPEAKLKIINALKASGEIVAMTGDGVNDAPALKSADIGIAMGERGTAIARQAADLVLTDDDLDKMAIAISEGRKIFSNLKKAVRYIISIHIPIILVAALPVMFDWKYPNIFTPIHIIFMELIMGPTCSIFFEKEPAEEKLMEQKPRDRSSGLFEKKELLISMLQGVIIAAGALMLYAYFMNKGAGLKETRTIVFTMLITSNIFLTFVGRSFTKTIFYTYQYKNALAPFILVVSLLFLAALHYISPVRNLFQLERITSLQFWISTAVAFVSVMWFEFYKVLAFKKEKSK